MERKRVVRRSRPKSVLKDKPKPVPEWGEYGKVLNTYTKKVPKKKIAEALLRGPRPIVTDKNGKAIKIDAD